MVSLGFLLFSKSTKHGKWVLKFCRQSYKSGATSANSVVPEMDVFRKKALNEKQSVLYPSNRGIIPNYAGEKLIWS